MKSSIWFAKALQYGSMLVLAAFAVIVGIFSIQLVGAQLAARGTHTLTVTATASAATNGAVQVTCGVRGVPACATPDPGWIPLSAQTPAAVVAAMKQTWIFQIDLNDGGDHVQDLSHLGTPFLVRGLARSGRTVPDYYVLPIMDAHSYVTDVGMFELKPDHSALRFSAISGFDGRYPIVRQTEKGAITALWQQHHMALKQNTRPYLIYLVIDAASLETGQVTWNAGGLGPTIPLWLLQGADGKNYVFGNDGKIYSQSEIPLSA
jgi:hypothetical protein